MRMLATMRYTNWRPLPLLFYFTTTATATTTTTVLQDDLVGMRKDLESEAKQLQQDRGKQERLATTITNQMQADAQVNNARVQHKIKI